MKGNRMRKYVGLTLGLTLICTVGFFAISGTNVFGQFIPEKPYVTGEPAGNTSSLTFVTNEGGNQKGSQGSEKEPLDGVPEAKGQKGSKTNPFLLLEIVPEHAQQQMVYMNGKDKNYPLDVVKIGIDASDAKGNSFIWYRNLVDFNLHNSVGEWFCRYSYNIYKFGKGEKTEAKPLVEIDKLYTYDFSDDDIEKAGYSPSGFKGIYNNGYGNMADLEQNFSALFPSDDSLRKGTWEAVIKDNKNWEKSARYAHELEISSAEIEKGDENLPIGELVKKYPDAFSTDKEGNLLDKNGDIVKQGELQDSAKWNKQTNYSAGYNVEISELDVKESIDENTVVSEFAKKYPAFFQKDKNGNAISAKALQDDENWTVTIAKGKTEKKENGYMINVGMGKGDFYAKEVGISDGGAWAKFEKNEDPEKNQWIYSETLPADAFPLSQRKDYDKLTEPWTQPKDYSAEDLVGGYFACQDFSSWGLEISCDRYQFKYGKAVTFYVYQYNKMIYSFNYYGLRTNDILKRMLFTFDNEEECNDFNMQVIAMTPEEINEAVRNDTPETLDIVERADMFYVGSYDEETDGIENVYEMYHKYIKGDTDYTFSAEDMKNFDENDLDWASCYKILNRLCNNPNLPLMLTQGLGDMVNKGVDGTDNTHMYVTDDVISRHIDSKGSLNNMAKLYLLTVQFDMLAKKSDGGYERTFYDDILPKLQTIALNPDALKGAKKNTASSTGYYERKLVEDAVCGETELTDEEKKTCFYLWNLWTFYPPEIKLSSGNQVAADKDVYVKYGYLESFFDSNADVFHDGVADHHSGSDGYDGKNVGIVHGDSNSDTNHSTLLGAAEGSGNLNRAMDTAYQIMNKQTPAVEPLTIKVEQCKKEYQKLSDALVLIDYNKDADYGNPDDKTLFVKLTISNTNNEDGILRSLKLVENEEDAEGITLTPRKTKEKSTELSQEDIRDINDQNPVKGYRVPANGSLTIYVPYRRADWQKGNSMIQLVTQGRKYVEKKSKVSTLGAKITNAVEISERILFNLE